MSRPAPAEKLCVLGLVYLEVTTPPGFHRPPMGREEFADGIEVRFGGALNSASVARALGWRTSLAFPSGGSPFDRAAREAVAGLDVTDLGWRSTDGPPISIVFTQNGERSFLSTANFETMRGCPQLPVRGWIHVAGLREALAVAPRLADARARGAKVSVAASWVPDELVKLADAPGVMWDLLVLNELESSLIAPEPGEAIEQLTAVAKDVVITSAGASRARLDGNLLSVEHEPARRVVDTTGAGDAFSAGLLLARDLGADPAGSLAYAGRVAAHVLSIPGGVVSEPSVFSGLEPPC